MEKSRGKRKEILEDFLEEDLPFLIEPHYKATIVVLKQKLQLINLSLDSITFHYPNFLEKIRYHLFFFFAHQINLIYSDSCDDCDFYDLYCSVALSYKHQYIHSFVNEQIQARKVQETINRLQTKV